MLVLVKVHILHYQIYSHLCKDYSSSYSLLPVSKISSSFVYLSMKLSISLNIYFHHSLLFAFYSLSFLIFPSIFARSSSSNSRILFLATPKHFSYSSNLWVKAPDFTFALNSSYMSLTLSITATIF